MKITKIENRDRKLNKRKKPKKFYIDDQKQPNKNKRIRYVETD